MQVHFGLDQLKPAWDQAVVCIGTFDGVHVGHRSVIRTAVEEAERRGWPCALLTFDRHPAAVLAPERCPVSVGTLAGNLREFEALGVSVAIVLAFTRELSLTSAEEFLNDTLKRRLRASEIVVGQDFAFGHKRQGTPEWLCERISTKIVPPVTVDGQRVSSSAIRAAILAGQVEQACRWLGRPFELGGVVVRGARKGRELGFPTLNLAPTSNQAVPADGVYHCTCTTPWGEFEAAGSVGTRPTFDGSDRVIEAHLLDYAGDDLYGKPVRLRFHSRIREQARFETVEELRRQMAADVETVRRQS